MYIVGHCVIANLSGDYALDIYGEDCIGLMLPDIIGCHDWGYAHCLREAPVSPVGQLMRMHLLADWFIHFGEGVARERVGWAYRKMSAYAREYDEFFTAAAKRGLHKRDPRDSRRGFSHTMVEYSIDTWLIRNGYFDGRFESVRAALGRVGGTEGTGSMAWIQRTIRTEGIGSDSPDLAADANSFGSRVIASRCPEEFVYRAGVKKFGLAYCDAAIELMADTLNRGLAQFSDDEIHLIVNETARFLGQRI